MRPVDDDDDDTDSKTTRRQKSRPSKPPPSPPSLVGILHIVRIIVWVLLFLSVCGGGLLFCVSLSGAQSAPQEASAGAVFSTVFIGLYILTRCIEKVLASVEGFRSRSE